MVHYYVDEILVSASDNPSRRHLSSRSRWTTALSYIADRSSSTFKLRAIVEDAPFRRHLSSRSHPTTALSSISDHRSPTLQLRANVLSLPQRFPLFLTTSPIHPYFLSGNNSVKGCSRSPSILPKLTAAKPGILLLLSHNGLPHLPQKCL